MQHSPSSVPSYRRERDTPRKCKAKPLSLPRSKYSAWSAKVRERYESTEIFLELVDERKFFGGIFIKLKPFAGRQN